MVLKYGTENRDQLDVCIAKPGLISTVEGPNFLISGLQALATSFISLPLNRVDYVAAAMIQQVMGGFEKDTLLNDDLTRIGKSIVESKKLGT